MSSREINKGERSNDKSKSSMDEYTISVERIEPEEIFRSVEIRDYQSKYQPVPSIGTYQQLLAISRIRVRLFVSAAGLGLIWFSILALRPILRSIFAGYYPALNESLSVLIFGFISICVSVGVGTLLIQFRVQNRRFFNPVAEPENTIKKAMS